MITSRQPPPQLILTREDVLAVAPSLADINRIIEETYRFSGEGLAEVPVKIGVHPGRPHSFLHAMPAWVEGSGALGIKWISYYPGQAMEGPPDSGGLIVLNEPEHGHPISIMEGMWITAARTAACGAVAARHLAIENPRRLGLIGCGGLGNWSLRLLGDVFPSIQEVYVSSRTTVSRNAFCAEMGDKGRWTLTPVDRVEDAVAHMDIVVSSVPQGTERIIKGAWVSPGTLVIPLDVVSGWDDVAYENTDLLVTDDIGALQAAVERRRPDLPIPENIVSTYDVVLGRGPKIDRTVARIMTIPTGVASVDITLAQEIYRRAREAGVGTEIRLL